MYRRALAYYRPELPRIVASFAMVAAGTFLNLVPPLTLALLIGLFQSTPPTDWAWRAFDSLTHGQSLIARIGVLTVVTLLVRLAKELLQMYQTLLNIRIGYHGLMHARNDLFRKLQELSVGYHRSQPQGDAIYRLSWDTFGFQSLYNVVFGSAVNVLSLLFMVGVMLSFNWKLTLVSMAVVPPLLLAILKFNKVMQDYGVAAKQADAQLTTAIQRSVSAISLVQAFNRQADEQSRFTSTIRNSIAAYMTLHRIEVLYWLVLGVIFTTGSVALFGYGGYLATKGELSASLLSAFLGYLAGFYDPLNRLTATGSSLQGAVAGVRRVFEVLDCKTAVSEPPGAVALPPAPRTLELRNVSFSYALSGGGGGGGAGAEATHTNGQAGAEPAFVLKDVSVTIPPGQMVAFVGSSGVGKTTLLSLLPRFYDVTSGAILLGDRDIRTLKLADLRNHIALVLQENIVLPTSVAENIAYGRPNATPAEIRQAAKDAGALDFIEALPQQFNTEVAEGGGNLSGGQRQRLGIARALLTNSPILVLDEPTSALDPHTELLITQTLEALRARGGRTLILVSHRLSTVLKCDQIFVMHQGRVVEHGTHDQLVAARGMYYEMARHQLQLA